MRRDAVWEGVQSYCTGPGGSGRKHRRKRTKDILKYAPFDIDRNVGEECHSIRVMLTVSRPACIQYLSPLVMVKQLVLTAALHLSNKVTVYLIGPQEERDSRSQEMHRSGNTEECISTKLESRTFSISDTSPFKCVDAVTYLFDS